MKTITNINNEDYLHQMILTDEFDKENFYNQQYYERNINKN